MYSKLFRICSFLLVIVLLVNMLPASVLAEELQAAQTEKLQAVQQESTKTQIVEEVTNNRTQYSKEFMLSSGMHMAVLYPEAVHFEKDGQWEEIDNTLKAAVTTKGSSYTNTAGVWQVTFPQSMTKESAVTITKDGYTLSFFMNGQLRTVTNGEVATAAIGQTPTYTVQAAQTATAQVQRIDLTAAKESATHPETVPDKLYSRLQYTGVYENTNVVYDLSSNRVKESIVMAHYNAQLRGYQYTLQTGAMIPVVREDGSIDLYDEKQETVIMVMPAPFLVDSANEYSYDVEVTLTGSNGTYTLTYQLPQSWLAAQERQWPVILDPVITADMDVSNIKDATVYQYNPPMGYTGGVLECGHMSSYGKMRSFLKYQNLPALKSSDVVLYAQLRLLNPNNSSFASPIEVRKVNGNWESETITWANQPGYGDTVEDYAIVQNIDYYYWNITEIVRDWYATGNTGLVLRAPDSIENDTTTTTYLKQFYSSDYSAYNNDYKPCLEIVFRNNNGLESYWDYTTASAGRAGTGYVNNYTGNLVWVHSDLGIGGNRMPVSISHVHNANDAGENSFGLGHGWRTNYNQKVYQWTEDNSYYVWEDSDGTDHYFKYNATNNNYEDEDGLELTLTTTGSGDTTYCIKDKKDNCSYFDASGRLTKQENNQQTKSSVTITYVAGTDKIATVTDGVGRVYHFDYPNGLLSRISYKGKGTNELDFVAYSYTGNQLTEITYKDNEKTTFAYNSANLITCAKDIDDYKIEYTYNSPQQPHQPYRVLSVQEKDGDANGSRISIAYANNQTTFTDHNNNVEIMQFNNWGNTIAAYDGEGRAQLAQYSFNARGDDDNNTDPTKKGNQLARSSKLQNTVANWVWDMSFEGYSTWNCHSGASCTAVGTERYSGLSSLQITGPGGYVSNFAITVPAGKSATFSAYMKAGANSTAWLTLNDTTGASITGEQLSGGSSGSSWERLQVTYINNTGVTQTVEARAYANGTAYMDCVQLEATPTASRYNYIDNGDFAVNTHGWSTSDGFALTGYSTSPAPCLNGTALTVTGDPTSTKSSYQHIQCQGVAGETLILSGWAKGDSAPLTKEQNRTRSFGLRITLAYTDGSTKTAEASFNPDMDAAGNWQYTAVPIIADKDFSTVWVYLVYDYNVNTVSFDAIQLHKEEFGSSYTYDEDGNVVSVKDLQEQVTHYEYTENDLTKIMGPGTPTMTYTYDDYHNVKTAVTGAGIAYTFDYDTYGNNTAVSTTNGTVSMSATAWYSYTDSNYISQITDAAGNFIQYSYNENTGLLEYAHKNDVEGTRYTYDSMNRVINARALWGSPGSASYTYADDLLTALKTESTTYNFTYGEFSLRNSVSIGTRPLASYSYTDDQNRYLTRLDYGNYDSVSYTYDNYGRLTAETYEDGQKVTYFYDNDGALAKTVDSETGIETAWYYDTTGRLTKYTENGAGRSYSLEYTYDYQNNLDSEVETINGVSRITAYRYDSDNRLEDAYYYLPNSSYTYYPELTLLDYDNRIHYIYDAYGRLQQQTVVGDIADVYTSIEYELGQQRKQYIYEDSDSSASSRLKSIRYDTYNSGETATYTYDFNGNIKSETFSYDVTRAAQYTYDFLDQITSESNVVADRVWEWTYDDAGNISSRKTYDRTNSGGKGTLISTDTYTYGDSEWGDLLTAYNGTAITYDQIGNRLTDGTWTYTWEHGRELASMSNGATTWSYTYDANGLRTQRTNGTTTYTYFYSGSQLVQMQVGSDTLYFTYDPLTGAPVTVEHNGTVYYYITNQQGDVIGISGNWGTGEQNYYYDAWGRPVGATSTTGIMQLNPLRYRGYVYDRETGLYYVSSRYYDPEIGRWISPEPNVYNGEFDEGAGLIGYNVYAYCANNPVNFSDPTGEFALGVILGRAAIGAAVNVLTTYIGAKVTGQSYSWKDAGVAALAGALGTGGTVLKVAAGVVSGLYTGVTAYQNGADLGKAVLAGAVSAWGTTVSVANIAGWTGPALELGVSTFTDVVFGAASNSIAAATYRASIETSTSNNTKQQVGTQCANNLKRTKLYCDKRLR